MIKKIFLVLYRSVASLQRKLARKKMENAWDRDADTIRLTVDPSSQEELPMDAKFLILAPHSDDEWIGCSQIIQKRRNICICNMDMSGDDNSNIHKERFQEMSNLAEYFQRNFVSVGQDKVASLSKYITMYSPDYILLPYYKDWHREHIEVMSLLKDAINLCEYNGQILMYQVSVPIPLYDCNTCISMTKDEQKYKWKVFRKVYKTQSFMPQNRFAAYERVDGGLVRSYAAEVYSMYSVCDWVYSIDQDQFCDEEKRTITNNLNDVAFVWRFQNESR